MAHPRDAAPPRAPLPEHDTAALREAYAKETGRLLKRRIDLAAVLFLGFVGLALVVDVALVPQNHGLAVRVYAAEVLLCLVAVVGTRLSIVRRHASLFTATLGACLSFLMNLYFARVGFQAEIQALGLVCLMTAFAVLVPAGWIAQIALAAATLGGFWVASAELTAVQAAYSWVGLLAGATTSVFGAFFLDRYRFEAFARAALLEQASETSRQEARISAALAHVGGTLHATSGHLHVFETVNRLARELLEVDWSTTYVLDETAGGYRLESCTGMRPEIEAELSSFEFPLGSLPLFREFRRGGLVEVRRPEDQDLIPVDVMRRFEAASALYVPLWRGDTVIGVLGNGYRTRTGPFTPTQRRIALGIGNAAAVALENERLLQNLKTASRLKSEFVSTMSHELRTPLNVITGYTEMLSDPDTGNLSRDQLDIVRRINRNASSLLELIESTLHLGRLEAGRDTLQMEWIDLGELFDDLAEANEEIAAAHRVEVEWHRSGLAGDPLRIDRGKLRLILQNLIGNAIKFSPGGRVQVSASGAEDTLTIEIRDTGVGIPPAELEGVFEMFRQLDTSAPGVGLGLHIVKRLTQRLGGAVSVASEPGRGTCFTVSIPAAFEPGRLARTG